MYLMSLINNLQNQSQFVDTNNITDEIKRIMYKLQTLTYSTFQHKKIQGQKKKRKRNTLEYTRSS